MSAGYLFDFSQLVSFFAYTAIVAYKQWSQKRIQKMEAGWIHRAEVEVQITWTLVACV